MKSKKTQTATVSVIPNSIEHFRPNSIPRYKALQENDGKSGSETEVVILLKLTSSSHPRKVD
ncbi:hypothetical protein [Streptococcus merionis]|uniref:hypothetical protein n=1 Tax=Streptococcus merionis TaxID=400065 RepID=UPI0012E9DAEF|nr:hypothetical protein [Streptococcus merionis]